ncbi:hypothetical protein [Paraburkholderia sp. SIMBA_054]|uniref:hypothetical protein n=1 Tax=Paraburkholderia sp. SIMBA_054 TaxID=3085795 RepID=UPI0039785656
MTALANIQPPASEQELAAASAIIAEHGVCIAHIQRRMRIGWNRAAGLAEAIVGFDALPEVAKIRRPSVDRSPSV